MYIFLYIHIKLKQGFTLQNKSLFKIFKIVFFTIIFTRNECEKKADGMAFFFQILFWH